MMKFLLLLLLSISSFGLTESDKADIGNINQVKNGGFEQCISSWAKYNDSAQIPVDGSGGSASSTFACSSSSPLSGGFSATWSKTAANRQGEGFSTLFTLDTTSKNSYHTISFDYAFSSGTYADDDLRVYVYDVTNSTLIYVSTPTIKNHLLPSDKFLATFQTTTGTQYRLLIHTNSNDATRAYTLKIDNVRISKISAVTGFASSDWVAYTPTYTGAGTVSFSSMYSRRNGPNLQINGIFQCGTPTAVTASMTLGFNGVNGNVSLDTTKLGGAQPAGMAWQSSNGEASFNLLSPNAAPNNYLNFGAQTSTKNAFNVILGTELCAGAGYYVTVDISVPINGWNNGTVLSDNSTGRISTLSLSETSASYINNTVIPIDYSTVIGPNNGGYTVTPGVGFNSGTGAYTTNPKITINESGWYFINASHRFTFSSNPTVNTVGDIVLYKNGSQLEELSLFSIQVSYNIASKVNGAALVYLVAGDYIDIRWYANFGVTTSTSGGGESKLAIAKISIPQSIITAEPVLASYTGAPTGTPSVTPQALKVPTVVIDTNGAYNPSTGIFTAPRSGRLKVTVAIAVSGTGMSQNTTYVELGLYNGATIKERRFVMDRYLGLEQTAYGNTTFGWINVLAGDQIMVKYNINTITTPTFAGYPEYHHLDFEMK